MRGDDVLMLLSTVYDAIVTAKMGEDSYEYTVHGTPRDEAWWRAMKADTEHIEAHIQSMHQFPKADKTKVEH